ncbi:hypothetical protein EDC04DRAFT_2899497 [Pisolithus marmoratus]|nr:hypothetical protein EDC04DRAFT_2899497 [Pisolithus marmoratus]
MDGSFMGAFHDSDSEEIHVYSPPDKGKHKADESFYDNMSAGESNDCRPVTGRGSYNLSSHTFIDRDGPGISESTIPVAVCATHKRAMVNAPSTDEDSLYESFYESALDLDESKAAMDDMDAGAPHTLDHPDLASSVKGLYRILDLITGTRQRWASRQDYYLSRFVERFHQSRLSRRAVYGSKEEIVQFLSELRVIDDCFGCTTTCGPKALAGPPKPILRSGLYLLRPTEPYRQIEQIFVVYWPQENTWDDSAPSPVHRNRVTFMRYLTKMCDQVVALISSAHAQTIVWNDAGVRDEEARDEDYEGGRIINCVVDRTMEQEESVQVREGFKVTSRYINCAGSAPGAPPEQGLTKPFLLYGETAQGFMTVQYQEAKRVSDAFRARSFTNLQLEGYLVSDRLCLSESLDDEALNILVCNGLKKRFPDGCAKWEHDLNAIGAECKSMGKGEFERVKGILDEEEDDLTAAIHKAVVDAALKSYPFLERESFPNPRAHQTTTSVSLQELVGIYPQMDEIIRRNIRGVETISSSKFRDIKDRLCLLVEFVSCGGTLSESQLHAIAKAAAKGGLTEAPNAVRDASKTSSTSHATKLFDDRSELLIYNPREDKVPIIERTINYFKSWIGEDKHAFTDRVLRDALRKANNISDSRFLKEIVTAEVIQADSELRHLAHEATMEVQPSLAIAIPRIVKKLVGLLRSIQEDTIRESIKADTENLAEQKKRNLRLQFIRHVNDSMTQTQQRHTFFIESVAETKSRYSYHPSSQWKTLGCSRDPRGSHDMFYGSYYEPHRARQTRFTAQRICHPSPCFHGEHKFRLAPGYTVLYAPFHLFKVL